MFQVHDKWPEGLESDEYVHLSSFAIGYLLNKANSNKKLEWVKYFINDGFEYQEMSSGEDLYQTLLNMVYRVRNESRGSRIVSDIFVTKGNENFKQLSNDKTLITKFLGITIHYVDGEDFLIDENEMFVVCRSKIPVISYKDLVFLTNFNEKTV